MEAAMSFVRKARQDTRHWGREDEKKMGTEVIGDVTLQYSAHDFLFVFNGNNMFILYRFPATASYLYTKCQKNDTDLACNNSYSHQLILIIFGRNVAETVCYQTGICFTIVPN